MRSLRGLMVWAACAGAAVFHTGSAVAEEQAGRIRVTLSDGLPVDADHIGPGSNAERLVLTIRAPGMSLSRSITWRKVRTICFEDRTYSADEFRRTLAGAADGEPVHAVVLSKDSKTETIRHDWAAPAHNRHPSSVVPLSPRRRVAASPRPVSNPSHSLHVVQTRAQTVPYWAADCPPGLLAPGLPLEAKVVGVQADPLSAYRRLLLEYFPDGVPRAEAPFILQLMRERTAAEALSDVPFPEIRGLEFWEPEPEEDSAVIAHSAGTVSHREPSRRIQLGRPVPDIGVEPVPPHGAVRPTGPALGIEAAAGSGPVSVGGRLSAAGGGRIRSIAVEARPINSWGRADWDALDVVVHAADERGRPVPVHGTVQAVLWGRKQEFAGTPDAFLIGIPREVTKIAAWTRTVGSAAGGERFQLPLPRPLPEHDLRLFALGELQVTLLAPGAGVFEASQPDVPLRRPSAVRERQLAETGSVFFPTEQTTDSRRQTGQFIRRWTSLRPTRVGPRAR